MKIAFLCKRRYTGRDLIDDRFGRLYEVPYCLARFGHSVRGFCIDYYSNSDGFYAESDLQMDLVWHYRSLEATKIPKLLSYPKTLLADLKDYGPDLIVGASDIPHVLLSVYLARVLGVPCVVDLYDNFESFGQAKFPGLIKLFRSALKSVDLIVVVSCKLKEFLEETCRVYVPIIVMPNGVCPDQFYPQDKFISRNNFGLPPDAKLVGTAGQLSREKGVAALYKAWETISSARSDVYLVLAGSKDKRCPPPRAHNVRYLGELPYSQIPKLFNALDVGVIPVRDSSFGRYCFPQKALEMLACKLPVAVGGVGEMRSYFDENLEILFSPDDPRDMARVILSQLELAVVPSASPASWSELVASIEPRFRGLV